MKRMVILTLGILSGAILAFNGCGSDNPAPRRPTPAADTAGSTKAENRTRDLDVDKLDIPERMKEAIKSGRIPRERLQQFLETRNQGGPLPTVKVESVRRMPLNAFLILNGVVEPERKVEVYARLSAYVRQIVKEEGDYVKKDDLLALMDDTEISISYRQAGIELEQAKLTLRDEETNHERSTKLKETDMISEQDFQTAESNYHKARLDYQTKMENFKDLELQLSYSKIRSPVEGYVTQRLIEVGSRVTTNQHVYTVEDFSPLLVKVFVPTADVVSLTTGMESEISTDVLSHKVFRGTIKIINPRIDEQSGTVKVTIEVFDKTGQLKPGMFVETKMLIRNRPDALVVPQKSITYRENRAYVFVFRSEGRRVTQRAIETGISQEGMVEVMQGLEEGDSIVTVGVEGLKDQMTVRTVQ